MTRLWSLLGTSRPGGPARQLKSIAPGPSQNQSEQYSESVDLQRKGESLATRSLCQFSSKRLDVLRIQKYERWYSVRVDAQNALNLPAGSIHWVHNKIKTAEYTAEDKRQKELLHSFYASITVSGHRYSTPPWP